MVGVFDLVGGDYCGDTHPWHKRLRYWGAVKLIYKSGENKGRYENVCFYGYISAKMNELTVVFVETIKAHDGLRSFWASVNHF